MNNKNTLTLSFRSESEKKIFLEKMSIFKDNNNFLVDMNKVDFLDHCRCQYGVSNMNSDNRKTTAYNQIIKLMSSGHGFTKIAEWLNDNHYTSSRGKRFYAQTVKRLFLENKDS